MSQKRINQLNELIRQKIAQFFLSEVDFPQGCLVTVVKTEVSSDLTHAKVWLTVFPLSFQANVLKILAKNIYHLQKLLDRKMTMRYVPKISFKIDYSEEKAAKIDQLLDKLRKES